MSTFDFIIDTIGDENLQGKTELINESDELIHEDEESKLQSILKIFDKKCAELDEEAKKQNELEKKLDNLKLDSQFDQFFEEMGWNSVPGVRKVKKEKKKKLFHFEQLDLNTGKLKTPIGAVDVEKEMQKSVLKPGLEQEHSLPDYKKSTRKLKAERKKEREKTKGDEWFNMPAPELTEELKNELQVLKMRSAMDPKHFYKKNDMEVLPKYFQVGRVLDSSLDHQNERLTKKQRKQTIVDELLADAEFQKYNKKKYKEILDEKRKTEYRSHMRGKRQKRKAELKTTKDKSKKKKTK